jgi:hypothetical protein
VAWPDDKLLNLKLCDLRLGLNGGFLSEQIARLYAELESRRLVFRPHFWLSDEWFTPDGVPGIAIPFYLAHPRLARLELSQMLEVEGGLPSGACAFCAMRRDMPSKTPTCFVGAGAGSSCSGSRRSPIPIILHAQAV